MDLNPASSSRAVCRRHERLRKWKDIRRRTAEKGSGTGTVAGKGVEGMEVLSRSPSVQDGLKHGEEQRNRHGGYRDEGQRGS